MIPEKFEDEVRVMAFSDGMEAAGNGGSLKDNEWMPGTIFHDDFVDGFNSVPQ